MPRRSRQNTQPTQPETVGENSTTLPVEQAVGDSPTPELGAVQDGQAGTGTPIEGAETPQMEQTDIGGPAEGAAPPQAEQDATGTPTEGTETPQEEQAENRLPMSVTLRGGIPAEDIVATADVKLGDICTIRNVKLKQDDYGVKVVMPRTKVLDTGRFKDACYFHSAELREQFDAAVKDAYQQSLQQENTQEQGGMGPMTM